MIGHIKIGTQLRAPDGYLNLKSGVLYHFLIRGQCVRLISFEERPPVRVGVKQRIERPPPEVHLVEITGDYFDNGLDLGMIVVQPYQEQLPPWCAGLGKEEVGEIHKKAKQRVSHQERLDRTLKSYQPLIDQFDLIIKDSNPFEIINRFARLARPQINGKALRAKYFAYMLYGCDSRIISYQGQRIGRGERALGKKSGRKAIGIGKSYFHSSNDAQLVSDVRLGWEKYAHLGTPISKIYGDTCSYIWKTVAVEDSSGLRRQSRPDGGGFLTYEQFKYRLFQIFGREAVYEKIRGFAYVREEISASRGKFTESLLNAGDRTEADGYWLEELVIGPDGKNALPAIVVVRIVCVTTGMFLGIGFSIGGETAAAYRMAVFCMSVKKSFFGRLIGLDIDDRDWPSVGFCDDCVTDRGAGGGKKTKANIPEGMAVISTLPPTGFGQGKATIESSHPRKIQMRDRPAYRVTSYNIMELIRREVSRTIALNKSRDIAERITPSMLKYLSHASPVALYNGLSERGRNNLRSISMETAIRAFLTQIELTVKPDGLYYRYQRYTAKCLVKIGLLQASVGVSPPPVVRGYMLDMSTRFCFFEWNGDLLEVAAILALREDDEQLFISLHEVEVANEIIRRMKSDARVNKGAVMAEEPQDFMQKTGSGPERTVMKPGRPHRRPLWRGSGPSG